MWNDLFPYVLLVLSVTIASFSQVLLKKSALIQYDNKIREYLNIYVIAGYGMTFLSMLLSLFAYRLVAYKNGPLIESAGVVIVMILSLLFFKEKITVRKWLGSFLVVIGMVVFYL